MDKRVKIDEVMLGHAIKELLYAFRKNGGDLDYCVSQIHDDFKKAGYRKTKDKPLPLSDKELKDKLRDAVASGHRLKPDIKYNDVYEVFFDVDKIVLETARAYKELGYHKIKGEPPLLRDIKLPSELHALLKKHNLLHEVSVIVDKAREAQRESDIKYMKGGGDESNA